MFEIEEYLDSRGVSPFEEWKLRLDPTSRVRIDKAVLRLRDGNLSAIKSVGDGVQELRLNFSAGFRIYLARHGHTFILLLGGGTKHRQQNDVEAAKSRWQSYKNEQRIKNANS